MRSLVARTGLSLVAGLTLIVTGPGVASARPSHQAASQSGRQACVGAWQVVPSPSVEGSSNYLNGVLAISADDAWAVGTSTLGSAAHPLTEHWNGRRWSPISAPDAGDVTFLQGVAATSSTDVWAVGYHYDLGAPAQTLVERWDGTAWTVVPSPSVGANSNYLLAVTAAGPADVWAVGYYYTQPFEDSQQTLVEHWDGLAWSVVSSPNHGTHANFLESVTAVSPTDAWAVGYYNPGDGSVLDRTLTLHWDGSAWTTIFSPDPGDNENILLGVAALSSTDVEAVGYYDNEGGGFVPLAEHWDGASWQFDLPLDATQGKMRGAAAVGGIATLAVGDSSSQTLTEVRRNRWTRLSSPNVGTGFNTLTAAASTSARDIWAVGYDFDTVSATYSTLVLHRCRS